MVLTAVMDPAATIPVWWALPAGIWEWVGTRMLCPILTGATEVIGADVNIYIYPSVCSSTPEALAVATLWMTVTYLRLAQETLDRLSTFQAYF